MTECSGAAAPESPAALGLTRGRGPRVFADSCKPYGYRRIAFQLMRAGIAYSVGLVAGLLREAGVEAVLPRAGGKRNECYHR